MMNNKIGVMAELRMDRPCFTELRKFGCNVCQLVSWSPGIWSEALAKKVRKEADDNGIQITSFWAGYPGPSEWNFTEGPITLGLIPATYRQMRIEALIKAADFAHQMGLPAIITHLGFIPENPADPVFGEVVVAVRQIALHLKSLGMEFWFETGQETPVTVLRLIQKVGTENMGINLDPANLILYGKGNPVDALDVFGKYVKNVHAKDGLYPTDPMCLGQEVRVGEGRVRFPALIARLKEFGYTGEFIIEREITGEQQARDIAVTVAYLQGLLSKT
ncbi:MAG: sugar phosphate isomerase/epimerase family protein [bacterium]